MFLEFKVLLNYLLSQNIYYFFHKYNDFIIGESLDLMIETIFAVTQTFTINLKFIRLKKIFKLLINHNFKQ